MENLSNEQIEQMLGKSSPLKDEILFNELKYFNGSPFFDSCIKDSNWKTSECTTEIITRRLGLEIRLTPGVVKSFNICVLTDQIRRIFIMPEERLREKRNKPGIGKDLLEKDLFGAPAALADVLYKYMEEAVNNSASAENIVTLVYEDEIRHPQIINFTCRNLKLKNVELFIRKYYLNKLRREYPGGENTDKIKYKSISVADELLKLKRLQDAGVLSQDEFDEQKAKLLSESRK